MCSKVIVVRRNDWNLEFHVDHTVGEDGSWIRWRGTNRETARASGLGRSDAWVQASAIERSRGSRVTRFTTKLHGATTRLYGNDDLMADQSYRNDLRTDRQTQMKYNLSPSGYRSSPINNHRYVSNTCFNLFLRFYRTFSPLFARSSRSLSRVVTLWFYKTLISVDCIFLHTCGATSFLLTMISLFDRLSAGGYLKHRVGLCSCSCRNCEKILTGEHTENRRFWRNLAWI